MNAYMKRLFRILRRRYGTIEQLIRTDDEHQFWAVTAGQPVCSRKTVYNLERGRAETDEDTVAFLIGKLGLRYVSGQRESSQLIMIAAGLKQAIMAGDDNGVERVQMMVEALSYEGVFLFDLWQLLLKAVTEFYRTGSFSSYCRLREMNLDDSIFAPDLIWLSDYVQVFFQVFVCGDFACANRIMPKLPGISEFDLAVLMIGQVESEQLLGLMISQLESRIHGLAPSQKQRLHYWMRTCLSISRLCHGRPDDDGIGPDPAATVRTVAERKDPLSRRFLQEISPYRNPLIAAMLRRKALTEAMNNRHYRMLCDVVELLEF